MPQAPRELPLSPALPETPFLRLINPFPPKRGRTSGRSRAPRARGAASHGRGSAPNADLRPPAACDREQRSPPRAPGFCFFFLLKTSGKLPERHTPSAAARAFVPRALRELGEAAPDPCRVLARRRLRATPARLHSGGNLPRPTQPEHGSFLRLLGWGLTPPHRGCSAPARRALNAPVSPRCLSPHNREFSARLYSPSPLPRALPSRLPTA